MFKWNFIEALRRLDAGSARRAGWLGVERQQVSEELAVQEKLLCVKEKVRRSLCKLDGFNRR